MTVNSRRNADRFRTTLLDGRSLASSDVATSAKLPAGPSAEWSFIRPLTNFGRALRVLANEAIDASRGRYDR